MQLQPITSAMSGIGFMHIWAEKGNQFFSSQIQAVLWLKSDLA